MGLIKAGNASTSPAPFSMRDIEAHAQAMLLRAQQQVDQLLAAAQTEGAAIRQRSYDQGFVAGKEDGLRRGTEEGRAAGTQAALTEQRQKLEQLIKALTSTVTEINSQRAFLESSAATQVIELAVKIAERVTKLQGEMNPAVLTENLRAAMRLVVHASDVRIHLHPAQKAFLGEMLPELRQQWPTVAHVELVEDPSVAPGGCRVLTPGGQVDAELQQQINRIAADLLPSKSGTMA